jgi:hypothetical protein
VHTASHQFPQTRRPATHKIAQAEIVSQVGFFGDHFPAATGIVVKELLGRGVLIEMDAVAML